MDTIRAEFEQFSASEYRPAAIYYAESDSLEYVRQDIPAIYRRVDNLLSLILSMDTLELIGFQVKGFRNFYLRHLKVDSFRDDAKFISLISVVEAALGEIGDGIFAQAERNLAYRSALAIATEDGVSLHDLPRVA